MSDSSSWALGAALYFDVELAIDPRPFAAVVKTLADSSRTSCLQWTMDVENDGPPPTSFDLDALISLIAAGSVSTAAVETVPQTPDADRMFVSAGTTPAAKRPERFVHTRCRYDFKASIGAARLRDLGASRALEAIVEFGDAVAARAGVVYWADTTVYASCLASFAHNDLLSREQSDHISDLMYWRPRWGDLIRGPAWGTFLGATHVATLGGIPIIERESGARVVALRSGGAFLQATPIDAPLCEGRDDGALKHLTAFLAPVMGRR